MIENHRLFVNSWDMDQNNYESHKRSEIQVWCMPLLIRCDGYD
jgi:hypothetical protein